MKKLDAYKLILKTINDCDSQVKLEQDISRYNLPNLIKKTEIEEEFGVPIKDIVCGTWFKCGYYSAIGLFGSEHNRTIAWSDDKRQPENEWLYQISFPTGAYIFGDDYCTKTFDEFFSELVAFNPRYSDSHNHNLYFTSDTSAKVHDALPILLSKYSVLVNKEIKEKKIAKLQEEIARLAE